MADLLAQLALQPDVRALLTSTAKNHRISHAYLFAGPVGCGKVDAAYAFAQAILCENDHCGQCPDCMKVEMRHHPDVRLVKPHGAAGYLVEQVREIVADATKAPIQAKKKVYILEDVDRLGTSAANAFLKTLEEPSDKVVLILLVENPDNVLPTILSRCQLVRFKNVAMSLAAQELARKAQVDERLARQALVACAGSLELSLAFCQMEELQELRKAVLDELSEVHEYDDWQIVCAARTLASGGECLLDSLKEQQEQELQLAQDYLAKGSLKQLSDNHKRQITAKTRELFHLRCNVMQSWLRDVLMMRAGNDALIENTDYRESIQYAASHTTDAGVLCSCEAVDQCLAAIDYNVDLQLCLVTLLFNIREDLYGPNNTR